MLDVLTVENLQLRSNGDLRMFGNLSPKYAKEDLPKLSLNHIREYL